MKPSVLIAGALVIIALAIPAAGQKGVTERPVTKREVSVSLRLTLDTPEELEKTNDELIEAVKKRGVDFALSPEEEWAFKLQDANDELLAAIRGAFSPEERQRQLNVRDQQALYNTFLVNRGRDDVASKQIAVTAGKEYLKRFRNAPGVSQNVRLIETTLPSLEISIRRNIQPVRTPSRRRN